MSSDRFDHKSWAMFVFVSFRVSPGSGDRWSSEPNIWLSPSTQFPMAIKLMLRWVIRFPPLLGIIFLKSSFWYQIYFVYVLQTLNCYYFFFLLRSFMETQTPSWSSLEFQLWGRLWLLGRKQLSGCHLILHPPSSWSLRRYHFTPESFHLNCCVSDFLHKNQTIQTRFCTS